MTTEKKPRTLLEPVAYRCMLRLPAAARFAENARPAIDDALAEAYALGAASRASPEEGRAQGPRCDSETPVRTSQGDREDEITRRLNSRFRGGVEAAARILAGKGIDCSALLDIRDPDTLTEIAETLAKRPPEPTTTEDAPASSKEADHG